MADLINTVIKDFDFPLFVAAFANKFNCSTLKISTRIGIKCPVFISQCKEEFQKFLSRFDYSKANVEEFFRIKFCIVRIEKGEIFSTESDLIFGSNVIYIHKKYVHSTRRSSL